MKSNTTTQTAKHTPAPWKITQSLGTLLNERVAFTIGADCRKMIVASVMGEVYEDSDYLEQTANARLISTAPELLEALKAKLAVDADPRKHLSGAKKNWDKWYAWKQEDDRVNKLIEYVLNKAEGK
jgi:hypothetical protein